MLLYTDRQARASFPCRQTLRALKESGANGGPKMASAISETKVQYGSSNDLAKLAGESMRALLGDRYKPSSPTLVGEINKHPHGGMSEISYTHPRLPGYVFGSVDTALASWENDISR